MTVPLQAPLEFASGERYDPGAVPYRASILRPGRRPPADLETRLLERLRLPTAGPPLVPHAPALVLVPDATRATFVRPMVGAVIEHLLDRGLSPADVHVLIAGGLHRPPSPEELRKLIGPRVDGGYRVHLHDADDPALIHCGTTRRGTPVWLPRLVTEARTLVIVGGITPHYFAGWTGGLKGLVPGAAGRATVTSNHRLAVAPDLPGGLHPACREGVLRGNPVQADLVAAARFAPPSFLVNVVLGREGEPQAVMTGSASEAHRAGVTLARRVVGVRVEPFDLAIVGAGAPGRERDWIQAHKVVRQGAACVADGGVLIALLACPDGVGSDTLLDWFDVDPHRLATEVASRYTLHGHTALAMRALTRRIRVLLVTHLAPEVVHKMGMLHAASLDEALSVAAATLSPRARALLLPRAGTLLPLQPVLKLAH